jgi:hypothetical protein
MRSMKTQLDEENADETAERIAVKATKKMIEISIEVAAGGATIVAITDGRKKSKLMRVLGELARLGTTRDMAIVHGTRTKTSGQNPPKPHVKGATSGTCPTSEMLEISWISRWEISGRQKTLSAKA